MKLQWHVTLSKATILVVLPGLTFGTCLHSQVIGTLNQTNLVNLATFLKSALCKTAALVCVCDWWPRLTI